MRPHERAVARTVVDRDDEREDREAREEGERRPFRHDPVGAGLAEDVVHLEPLAGAERPGEGPELRAVAVVEAEEELGRPLVGVEGAGVDAEGAAGVDAAPGEAREDGARPAPPRGGGPGSRRRSPGTRGSR